MKNYNQEKISIDGERSAEIILDKIFGYAVDQDVSSVMFDFSDDNASVYYSSLGSWTKLADIYKKRKSEIAFSLKSVSGIENDRRKIPKKGKFKKTYESFKVIFYVSVNPLDKGEKIFIDIFKEKSRLLKLKQLGMQRDVLRRVKKSLDKNSGMYLVLGDFNSGRTTTLYSLLDHLNRPEFNVCTIEQEIDIDIPYVNQALIDRSCGFDCASAFKSLMRQDPDVIMVGDILDKNTAESAFEASARGHIVLVGLYSRNMVSASQFLRDLDLPLHLFLEAVNIVFNQRIIKKTCHHCIIKDRKNNTKIKELKKLFDWKFLFPKLKELKIIQNNIRSVDDLVFYKAQGCDRCNNKGYKEYIGAYEILEISKEVKTLSREGHISKISEEVRKQGGLYIKEDALVKALTGITTIDEVLRVANL